MLQNAEVSSVNADTTHFGKNKQTNKKQDNIIKGYSQNYCLLLRTKEEGNVFQV